MLYGELSGHHRNESSSQIRERVQECHNLQKKRYEGLGFCYNSRIPAGLLERFCPLGERESAYMERMYGKLNLTARTYHRLLRVARTVADVCRSEHIGLLHLQEAVCYRSIDDRFWGGV